MDIASLSISMSMQRAQEAASVSVMKKAMNFTADSVEALLGDLQQANPVAPPSEYQFDVRV